MPVSSFSGRISRIHSCATDRRDRYTAPGRHPAGGWQYIGVEDCHLACFFQPFCAHHAMYIQLIGRIEALPNGAAETAPDGLTCLRFAPRYDPVQTVQMRFHTDRSHTRTTTAVRNAKVLCRLRCETSAPIKPGEVIQPGRSCSRHQGKPDRRTDAHFTHFTDRFFIHAVGRRISHMIQERLSPACSAFARRSVRSCCRFYHTPQPPPAFLPYVQSGVSSVRRSRDQADIAMPFVRLS